MARELDGEARMTIQTLAAHGVANTETARLLGVSVANLCDEAESSRLRLRQLPLPFPPRADTREPYRFDR